MKCLLTSRSYSLERQTRACSYFYAPRPPGTPLDARPTLQGVVYPTNFYHYLTTPAVAPPSSVVKSLWEVFVWGVVLVVCVCVSVSGVLFSVGVCVGDLLIFLLPLQGEGMNSSREKACTYGGANSFCAQAKPLKKLQLGRATLL